MTDSFNDLDWRDKPKASPTTGGLVQSRVGKIGDFHVVVPWPGGGLVHYSRDNFKQPELPWSGGTLFGDGHYIGAAIAETDYTSHQPTTVKNLDVLAVTAEGRVELWSRECGGDFRWTLTAEMGTDAAGPPSLSYTGSCFKAKPIDWFSRAAHGLGASLMAWPTTTGAVQFWRCLNHDASREFDGVWTFYRDHQEVTFAQIDPRPCIGVSAAMYVERQSAATRASWKDYCRNNGLVLPYIITFATTFAGGGLSVIEARMGQTGPVPEIDPHFANHMTIYTVVPLRRPLEGDVFDPAPARGSPCIFQSDYLLNDFYQFGIASPPQVGDLVVMAPARDGGILFWLKNFGDYNDATEFDEGWNFQYVIGHELYDNVSCIQSNFNGDTGNLEITAWRADKQGFDQYWADWTGKWGGPLHVLGEVIGTVQQPLLSPPSSPVLRPAPAAPPTDLFEALKAINVDYSVSESDLKEWLADPIDTPYPALANGLLAILWPRRLARPVQVDVVNGFYDLVPGTSSPRVLADIDLRDLRSAVVSASNERYGETLTDMAALIEMT